MSDTIDQLTPDERQAVAHVEHNKAAYAERVDREARQQSAADEAAHVDQLRNVVHRELGDIPGKDAAPTEVRRLSETVKQLVSEADRTFQEAAKARGDDTLPVETREARAQDIATVGQAKLDQLRDQALTEVEVAKAQLSVRALPKPTGEAETFARQDAEVTLGSASSALEGLEQLAKDSDPNVRALAAGSWGRRRLEAAGVRNADSVHQAIVTQALHHTATNDTGTRQRAAEAAIKLTAKPAHAGIQYASFRLGSLRS